MDFFEFLRWRISCLVTERWRDCGTCQGSDGHCEQCNKWHNLYKRDWRRTWEVRR